MSQRDEAFEYLLHDILTFAMSQPPGFRSLPHMLSPIVPRSSNRAPGLPPYPTAALEPEADAPQDIGDESLVVVAEPDRLDGQSVVDRASAGLAEHERQARLARWQAQR